METCEDPTDEMKGLIRKIGGPKMAGEADAHVRSRALRRLNAVLPRNRHITDRTAYSMWHGEKTDIPSHVMDAARMLASPPTTLGERVSQFIEAMQQVEHALVEQRRSLEAEIQAAADWRSLDRRSGQGGRFVGIDRRRPMDAVRRTVASSLHLTPDSSLVSNSPRVLTD